MPKARKVIPGVDAKLLIKDAAKLIPDPSRRLFLRGATSLGAITLLTGCDIVDEDTAARALLAISRFNDRVQAAIFDPDKLAPTYPESAITRPFPFNAYYGEEDAPEIDGETYMLEVGGLVENKKPWTLEELYALPQEKQITRHICVEGWSAIGKWSGVPLHEILTRAKIRYNAQYAVFHCYDVMPNREGALTPYYESIDMVDAFHPQTILAHTLNDAPLAVGHGAPLRLRVERQLGYKQAKYIKHITIVDRLDTIFGGNGGYWEDVAGYEWYGGI